MYAVLVIKNDTLKNLKGHSERSPGVILQERYQGGPVEPQHVAQGIFLNDAVRVFRIGTGLETKTSRVQGDIVRLGRVKGHFASDRRIDRDRGDLIHRIVKMAGKDVRAVVNQFHISYAGGPTSLAERQSGGAADAGDLEDHVASLGIESPDVTQAEI